jgi:hypothetical protein
MPFLTNHSLKGQAITGIDHIGARHPFVSLAAAYKATHISPPSLRKLLESGEPGHARGDDKKWTFYRGDATASAAAPQALAKRPSAALIAAGSSPALAPLDAAIAELQGQLSSLQTARDIMAAREAVGVR